MAARRDGELEPAPGTEEIEGLDFHQADGIDPEAVAPLLAGEDSLSTSEDDLDDLVEAGSAESEPKKEGEAQEG